MVLVDCSMARLFSNIHIFTFLDRLLNHHREFPRTALKYTVVESKTCSWNDFSCTPLRKIFINFVLSMLMSAGVLTTEAIQNDVVLLFTAGFARFLLALMVLQNIVNLQIKPPKINSTLVNQIICLAII